MDDVQARISIYERIRDIPYGVLPELIDAERYVDILKVGMGSCSPKHFLLCEMFRRLGLTVLFAVYPFRWGERAELVADYAPRLKRSAESLPMSHHIACKVEIENRLVVVDATLDAPLAWVGLPVNRTWDGFGDTLLPMTPLGDEELYHPQEAYLMEPHREEEWLEFYAELNACLQAVRDAAPDGN
jgi:hypothetical protein